MTCFLARDDACWKSEQRGLLHPLLYPEQGSSATRHLAAPPTTCRFAPTRGYISYVYLRTPTYPLPLPLFFPASLLFVQKFSETKGYPRNFSLFRFFFSFFLPSFFCSRCLIAAAAPPPVCPLISQPVFRLRNEFPSSVSIDPPRYITQIARKSFSAVFQLLALSLPAVCAKNERSCAERRETWANYTWRQSLRSRKKESKQQFVKFYLLLQTNRRRVSIKGSSVFLPTSHFFFLFSPSDVLTF